MHGWTGQKAWKNWSGRLAVAQEDDFERVVLPLLRLMWPGLLQAPRKRAWDQKGIDLLVWADNGPFPVAVQCKGFKVQDIGPDQYRQIEESIQAFLNSDAVAHTYLVVHNRDGKRRDLVARIEARLEEVVSRGKAKQAALWDRQETVTNAFRRMETLVSDGLRVASAQLAAHHESLFRFSQKYVDRVPVAERSLTFRRDSACEIGELTPTALKDPRVDIETASGTRWTILSGQFGLGKTTTALAATRESARPTVFVPCQAIPTNVLKEGNTNGLTGHIVDSLALLEDVDDKDRADLRAMAASVLSYLLREPNSPFTFILDGLDEHHFFSTLIGLQSLSNQLAEFSCPVVLTTRREHLEALLGDFNVAFGGLGKKFGYVRQAQVLFLQPWTMKETLAVTDAAMSTVEGSERDRIARLGAALRDQKGSQPYGDLVQHPLFLQFILEDVADQGPSQVSPSGLIKRWVERKVRRDRAMVMPGAVEPRAQIDPNMDSDEYMARIFRAMSSIAYAMSARSAQGIQLLEGLPSTDAQRLAKEAFGREVNLVPLLLNSTLTTLGPRRADNVPIGFALRILHEYFAALYLHQNGLSPVGWPDSVRALVADLQSSS